MKKIWFILLILLLSSVAFFSIKEFKYSQKKKMYEELNREIIKNISEFRGDTGIYIKDIKTGIVVSFDEDKFFPSASLVKIPLMACVFQAEKEGLLKLDDEITLKRKFKAEGSGILKWCKSGKKYKVIDLVELMITESDNTATNMLTDLLGFDYINIVFIGKFGFSTTRLYRNVMDLKLRNQGFENYTTAKEMGVFLEKLYKGGVISKEASGKMLNILSKRKMTDRIGRFLPKDLTIAHKTGLLKKICHDTGIVFTPKGDFIVCVLTSDFKSTKTAKVFIGQVAFETYKCY